MRAALSIAAALFLAAHVLSLPPTFEDLDSLNFALGVRDFEVAQHQPHPPGYPVYIALGKLSTAAARAAGVPAPEVRGLAIWSALAGALLIPLLYSLWIGLDPRPSTAAAATALVATAPLFWFTALRPLSDVLGLAAAVGTLAALVRAWPAAARTERSRTRWLLLGAAAGGLAIGIRSQTAVLTGPLLAATVLLPWSRARLAARGFAVVAFSAGVVTWAVPLLMASGGPMAYLAALSSQAGEDFGGVVMLWTHPTPRVAAAALLDTFMRPWDAPLLAGVILALAAAGALLAWREHRRALTLLALGFGPYLLFHLLFQESFTVRYALPIVLPVAWCAAAALSASPTWPSASVAAAICATGLWLAVPAGIAFGRSAAPIFAALEAMRHEGARPVLGMHRRVLTETRRARQWEPPPVGRTLDAPRHLEWLEVARALRGGDGAAWFLADPLRTDLALIDPHSRRRVPYRWPFNRRTYVGGARPDQVDLVSIIEPGWTLAQAWALTPETAGVARREGWTLDEQPATGFVRRRPGPATLLIGGRHLRAGRDAGGRIGVAVDGRELASFEVTPGPFLYWAALPTGVLDGDPGYAPLSVKLSPLNEGDPPPVALEQFDLQDADILQWAYGDGWQEPEYNPATGRSWRWTTRRASIEVRPTDQDVVLRLSGENPRRYFAAAPDVRVVVAGTIVHAFHPGADFGVDVRVPGAALAAAGGEVVIETGAFFVPGDRDGSADRRELALRIFELEMAPAR